MLDTSRRFYSVKMIKQIMDILAAAKFNVFHWHITDDDSFPWDIKSFPEVTRNGAFEKDQVYTQEMIKEIITYAESLALRVVPEFDNPGHVRAVGLDSYFNEIIRCFNTDFGSTIRPDKIRIIGGPPGGVLDPSYNKTYELLNGLLKDMNDTFPDNLVHLGGDEVETSCFDENPNITQFMTQNNITDYHGLVNYHMNKTRHLLGSINPNKRGIYWCDKDTYYQKYRDYDIIIYWGKMQYFNTVPT